MLLGILFDAVNNLRSVLDQTACASAVANGKVSPKSTNFPFGDDLAGLNNNIDGRKVCKDIPPEIINLFRSLQPHKGGNDLLWAFNKLCNAKKHCTLVPLQISNALATFYGTFPHGGSIAQTIPTEALGWDAAKNELILTRYGGPAAQPVELQISGHFSFSVAISGIEILSRQPAPAALDAMSREVERVLMATEVECRRIGLKID